MPRKINSLLFDWFFEASCNKHDEGYTTGGDEARRKVCDDKFLDVMKRDTMRFKGLRRGIRFAQAYVFYAIVRAFGWMQFNYKDK